MRPVQFILTWLIFLHSLVPSAWGEPSQCSGEGNGTTVFAKSGAEFIAALRDPAVAVVSVAVAKLALRPSDFDGVELPLRVTRNVNITGSPHVQGRPLVDFSFSTKNRAITFMKLAFRPGCTVVFSGIVVVTGNMSSSMTSETPGLDILTPLVSSELDAGAGTGPAPPTLVFVINVAYTFWMCQPPDTMVSNAAKYVVRPAGFPGTQKAKLTVGSSQADCDTTTQSPDQPDEARLMTRCWAQRFDYIDVVIEPMTLDPALGRTVSTGYVLHLLNSSALCASSAAAGSTGGSRTDAGSSPAGSPSQSGRTREDGSKLGVILGSTLGGCVALALLLVAGLLWRARQAKHRAPINRLALDSPISSDGAERSSQPSTPTDTQDGAISVFLDDDMAADASPSEGDSATCGAVCHAAVKAQQGAIGPKGVQPSQAPGANAPVTAHTRPRPSVEASRRLNEELVLLPNTLGKGSYGRVVEGTFRGRRVAVKLMPSELITLVDGSAVPTSFLQEVEVLGRCDHPNVVRLLAVNLRPPRPCLVMELMETSLDRLIRRGGGHPESLPMAKVLHIAIQVARGLEYLHPTITHRDLKPANVLLSGAEGPRPIIKLADFGLSRLRTTVAATEHPEAGTPAYMAPECFDVNNFVVTHHADMFSFGCLLWALLAGREPWAGLDAVAIATQLVVHRMRPPLDGLPPERCPRKLARLLAGCWEADPRRRPAAAEAVKELMLVMQRCNTST